MFFAALGFWFAMMGVTFVLLAVTKRFDGIPLSSSDVALAVVVWPVTYLMFFYDLFVERTV